MTETIAHYVVPRAAGSYSNYIVYVDESGDHSLTSIDPEYPVFVLSFCVFRKAGYAEAVTPAVRKLKFDTFGHDMLVLHESDIRRKRGAFSSLPREARKAFLNALTDVIGADKRTNSEGLQLADLTARPIGLSVLRPEQPNRAALVLEGKYYRDKAGNKIGPGLKVFP